MRAQPRQLAHCESFDHTGQHTQLSRPSRPIPQAPHLCRGSQRSRGTGTHMGTPTPHQPHLVESYVPRIMAQNIRKRGLAGNLYDWQVHAHCVCQQSMGSHQKVGSLHDCLGDQHGHHPA